jgi:hypothetical protein
VKSLAGESRRRIAASRNSFDLPVIAGAAARWVVLVAQDASRPEDVAGYRLQSEGRHAIGGARPR